MTIRHIEYRLHPRVRRPKRTKRAFSRRARVDEVIACQGDVRIHVGAAAHPRGQLDRDELGGRVCD